MIRLLKAREGSEKLAETEALYVRAFPENERLPFETLYIDRKGYHEQFTVWDGEIYLGFIALITCGTISHIIFFSILEEYRNLGFGTQVLQKICELKANMRVIADLEIVTAVSANNEQRIRRKAFYTQNGFAETSIKYDWCGESYEIVSAHGGIERKEFSEFWNRVNEL